MPSKPPLQDKPPQQKPPTQGWLRRIGSGLVARANPAARAKWLSGHLKTIAGILAVGIPALAALPTLLAKPTLSLGVPAENQPLSVPLIIKNEGLFSLYAVRATCILRRAMIGTTSFTNSSPGTRFAIADEIRSGDRHTVTCSIVEHVGTTEADVALALEFKTAPILWPGSRCYEIVLASGGRWYEETCSKAVETEISNLLRDMAEKQRPTQ